MVTEQKSATIVGLLRENGWDETIIIVKDGSSYTPGYRPQLTGIFRETPSTIWEYYSKYDGNPD